MGGAGTLGTTVGLEAPWDAGAGLCRMDALPSLLGAVFGRQDSFPGGKLALGAGPGQPWVPALVSGVLC